MANVLFIESELRSAIVETLCTRQLCINGDERRFLQEIAGNFYITTNANRQLNYPTVDDFLRNPDDTVFQRSTLSRRVNAGQLTHVVPNKRRFIIFRETNCETFNRLILCNPRKHFLYHPPIWQFIYEVVSLQIKWHSIGNNRPVQMVFSMRFSWLHICLTCDIV